jgi:hypothetical protein
MKINFRKIAPVLASAVLLGSTIGFAAGASDLTAYPGQFAGATIIYGSDAKVDDVIVGADFASDLSAKYGTTASSGTTSTSGETVKIETGSTKLHLGENLNVVKSAALTSSDMPSLLAGGTYQISGGSYTYEQKLTLAPTLTYNVFADLDYNSRLPTLGVQKSSNSAIMNYTLNFIKTAESAIDTSTAHLTDFENTDITMLGKKYTILTALNGTNNNMELDLMGGAVVDSLYEGTSMNYTINDKAYSVSVSNIASDGVALTVNGQTTSKIKVGGTYTLSDQTVVGVRNIWSHEQKTSSVDFSLGAQKLTLQNGQKMKMNDNNVNDVVVSINQGTNGAKATISSITLEWITNDKLFITKDKAAIFPGLQSVKITMGDLTTPDAEVSNLINSGYKTMNLQIPIKSGMATIPLISLNATKTGIGQIGTDASTQYQLVTTKGTEISFNRTSDEYFVATWNSTTDSESYLLKIAAVNKDSPSTGLNSTDITDVVTGSTVCSGKRAGDQCTIGNVVLNVNQIKPIVDGLVNITAGSGVTFDKVVSKDGLVVYLPVNSVTTLGTGYVNLTAQPTSWVLYMAEEDKSGNLGKGDLINATIGITSTSTSNPQITISDIDSNSANFAGTSKFDIGGLTSTNKYVAYILSDLATKLTYDTNPTSATLAIEYHGGEAYGNVYVASAAATVTSISGGAKANVVNMLDTDAVTAKPATNLIVVGGPAVNRVAAAELGVNYPTYGSQLTGDNAITADSATIKLLASTYDATKLALVVYGYEAKDTTAAGTFLINSAASLTGKSSVSLTTTTGTAVVKA